MCLQFHVVRVQCFLPHGYISCRLPDACSVVATLWEISSSFKSLSLEDPWLAAALSDGSVAMHHTEMASKHAKHRQGVRLGTKANSRLFQMPQGATCCVDLSDQRLVAGSGKTTPCMACMVILHQVPAALQGCISFHDTRHAYLLRAPSGKLIACRQGKYPCNFCTSNCWLPCGCTVLS